MDYQIGNYKSFAITMYNGAALATVFAHQKVERTFEEEILKVDR